MALSEHIIYRTSKLLKKRIEDFGDKTKSNSLKAKQMLILALNDMDKRHLPIVLEVVKVIESKGLSARKRQNDILEPFETVCNDIRSKIEGAKLAVDLDENLRQQLIEKIAKRLCEMYKGKRITSKINYGSKGVKSEHTSRSSK